MKKAKSIFSNDIFQKQKKNKNESDFWLFTFLTWKTSQTNSNLTNLNLLSQFLSIPEYFHYTQDINTTSDGSIALSRAEVRRKILSNQYDQVEAMQQLREVRAQSNISGFIYSNEDIFLEADLVLLHETIQNLLVTLGLKIYFEILF